jgi:alkaline phosphatase
MFRRVRNGLIGIVSTAFIADATPAALVAHTRDRDQYGPIIDSFLNGESNYSWTPMNGVDVLFGGGAESFLPGGSYKGKNYYDEFAKKGYNIVHTATDLQKLPNDKPALGIFTQSNMAKWVDRQIYPQNLHGLKNSPLNDSTDAIDQPGLKEMTIKAIDILHERSKKDKNQGWYLMSEATSIGQHVYSYTHPATDTPSRQDDARSRLPPCAW